MLDSEVRNPLALSQVSSKEWLHHQRLRLRAAHGREGLFNLLDTAEHQRLHLHAESRGGVLRFLEEQPVGGITPIGQKGHTGEARQQGSEQLQALAGQLRTYAAHPRNVATRPCEAGHQARSYRIARQS